jgi:hypothetical protein
MSHRSLALVPALVLSLAAGARAGAPIPILPSDVLTSWSDEPAPQWNQAPEGTDWVAVTGGVAQLLNGAGSRISDFGFSGDFTFSGIFRAIPEVDMDQDDDNFGVVFGWQDESNHYRLGYEGGGFGDNGDEFDPFVDEGASGAHGIWLVKEEGGVGTILFEAATEFWAFETDYGFMVSRTGDEISFEITQGVTVVASATVVDTTFPSGAIGLYVESQETEFRDLAATEPDLEPPCPTAPAPGCIVAAKASLAVKESKEGKEKLKLKLRALGSATTQASFGDPVSGSTSYATCLYGEKNAFVAALEVPPGGACGPKAKPCWKAASTKGYAYKDPAAAADGVRKLKAKAGDAGKGKLQLQAGNKSRKGQDDLPTGITEALEGIPSALVQIRTSDAECFQANLTSVKKAESDQFKAKTP